MSARRKQSLQERGGCRKRLWCAIPTCLPAAVALQRAPAPSVSLRPPSPLAMRAAVAPVAPSRAAVAPRRLGTAARPNARAPYRATRPSRAYHLVEAAQEAHAHSGAKGVAVTFTLNRKASGSSSGRRGGSRV